MNKFITMLPIISVILITSCSSGPKKKNLGEDISWICGDKKNLKSTGFQTLNVPNTEKGDCVQVKADRDAYWDFYIRPYEEKELPGMPDVP